MLRVGVKFEVYPVNGEWLIRLPGRMNKPRAQPGAGIWRGFGGCGCLLRGYDRGDGAAAYQRVVDAVVGVYIVVGQVELADAGAGVVGLFAAGAGAGDVGVEEFLFNSPVYFGVYGAVVARGDGFQHAAPEVECVAYVPVFFPGVLYVLAGGLQVVALYG